MQFLKTSTCMFLGMLPLANLATAQEVTPQNDNTLPADTVFLGRIVLTTPLDPTDEDGISLTSEGIALSNPADLSELFVAEPTIAVGSSIPMSQKLYVQGIEENNLAISINGARQNNLIFHHNTTTLIDPDLLEAVRIDPGVAPADAGPGALAGALAYQTVDARDLLEPGDNAGGSYKLEYLSDGNVLSHSLTGYGQTGGFEYLLFGRIAEGDERSDGDGVEIVGSSTDMHSLLGNFAYETENGHRLEFSYEQVNDDAARPYRANIGAIIGGRPLPATRQYEMERTNIVLSYQSAQPTALWDPTVRLAYSGTTLANDELDTPARSKASGETDSFSGEISNSFTLNTGEVNAGLDFFRDEATFENVHLDIPPFNYATSEKLSNIGLFAQARLEPADNTRVSFGMRLDDQKFTGTNGTEIETSSVSYNLSGEYDVTDQFTIGAGYSHVWGGLEMAENYVMYPAWDYSAGIEDVSSDNYYVAASYDAGGWAADAKIFRTEIDNARVTEFPDVSTGVPVGGAPNHVADVSSRGFELGFSTSWENGFFRIGYANIDTEVNGAPTDSLTGNYLTIPMGEFLTFQTAYEFDNGLLIGGDAQIAFDYDDTAPFGGSNPTIDGYEVFNVFAEYTPPRMQNLTLRAEVNNVLDQKYAARATYGQDFPGAVEPLYEPGRSILISAEMKF